MTGVTRFDPAAGLEGQDLAGATVRGVGWSAGSQISRQVVQIGVTILIARLLTPEAFGQVAQVMVFAGLATVLAEFGLTEAIVQRRELQERHVNAVFWVQVGAGLVLGGLVAVSGPLFASFYGDDALVLLSVAIAPKFVLSASGSVHRALLARALGFRRIAVVDTVALVLGGAAAIGAALLGAGVLSIVVQQLTTTAVTSAALFAASRWRPSFAFELSALRELLPFSRNLVAFSLITYAIRNTDNLLVGRFLGSSALGIYTRGYSILLYPSRRVAGVVGKVMFASLSRIQDDHGRLRRSYLRAIALISLITFPMMAGTSLVADHIVLVLLGERWRAAIDIIRIFALVGITESVSSTVGWIYKATGRTDALLRWGLWAGGVPLAGIAVGAAGGSVETVALGYAGATIVLLYPCWHLAGRHIGLRVRDVAIALWPTAAATGTMVVAVGGLRALFLQQTAPAVALGSQVALGAVVYVAALLVYRVPALADVRVLVDQVRNGGPPGPQHRPGDAHREASPVLEDQTT